MFKTFPLYSPLDQFHVYKTPGALIFGQELCLTSVGLYSLLSLGLLGIFGLLSQHDTQLYTSKQDTFYRVLSDSTASFVTAPTAGFFVLIFCVYLTLANSNLLGNAPFGYASTTSIPFAMGGSMTLWIWLVCLNGYLSHLSFFGQFIPAGTPLLLTPVLAPIETVSYSARSVSLGVRLFSNILAGHTLLAILADFLQSGLSGDFLAMGAATIALIPLSCIVALELAVSLIQGYVFSVLLVSYIQGVLA